MSLLKSYQQVEAINKEAEDHKGDPTYTSKYMVSEYHPEKDVLDAIQMIRDHFALGDATMQKPRPEFDDLSVLGRMNADRLSFNSYQPNNGEPPEGDELNKWHSRAFKPVVRNKCVSIAAHATARLVFPKVFSYDEQSNEQMDAAMVMEDLMEWANDQANYPMTQLDWTLTSLTDPASITYSEHSEVYRDIKTEKDEKGKWKNERILDETLSGFQDTIVPANELYIENIYESDIQKQGWLIWRKVISFTLAKAKYSGYKDFKYVNPGIQLIFNDANQSFYQVYDTEMSPYSVEEITYWNRNLDLKLISVNGVLLTDADNPNPRLDKLYPFTKSGYEKINSKFFYYKSLVSKMRGDATAINEIYPLAIDVLKLEAVPPMVNRGGEAITSDVIVPGAVTTLSDPNANLESIRIANPGALESAMKILNILGENVNESSQSETLQGAKEKGDTTAYQISRLEQNAATVLGLFMQMKSDFVRQFGKLRIGDILQYLTIADVSDIEGGNTELVYKTFFLFDKQSTGKVKKIKFDSGLPSEPISKEREMELSFETLNSEGKDAKLYRVNPELFRKQKYIIGINPDIKTPHSEELEIARSLEIYDRLLANPRADQDMALKDFLLSTHPKSKKDPDKYVAKENPMMPLTGQPTGSPLSAVLKKGALPQGQAVAPQI